MEESYAVHRRRKAAARKREKTPDPSSRNQLVESTDDEEGARRARMEKMADDAELEEKENRLKKQEEQLIRDSEEKKREESRKLRDEKRVSANLLKDDEASRRSNHEEKEPLLSRARENDAEEELTGRSVRKELTSKVDDGSSRKEAPKNEGTVKEKLQESLLPRSKEVDDEAGRSVESRKVERRVKKKSKERVERHSRSTDSSDMDEKSDRYVRRTKSPEGTRLRVKKPSAKRSSDPDGSKKDSLERPVREKRSSKMKVEEVEDQVKEKSERKHSRRYSQTDDTDEGPKARKSEAVSRPATEDTTLKKSAEESLKKSPELKKQIIPLSNDSLIQDFAKAQVEYLRERNILEADPLEVFQNVEQPMLRRRKFSVVHTDSEQEEITSTVEPPKEPEKKRSWFSWLPFFRGKKESNEPEEKKVEVEPEPPKKEETKVEKSIQVQQEVPEKVTFMDFLRGLKDVVAEFKAFVAQNPRETRIMRDLRNRCICELILVIIYCGLGAFVFRFTEGAFETFYKCGVKRVKRDFLDSLWNYSHNMREDDWKSMARRKLMEFEEQLHTAHEAGVHSYSGQKSWTFLNAVVYCLTVITTIGENFGEKYKRV